MPLNPLAQAGSRHDAESQPPADEARSQPFIDLFDAEALRRKLPAIAVVDEGFEIGLVEGRRVSDDQANWEAKIKEIVDDPAAANDKTMNVAAAK